MKSNLKRIMKERGIKHKWVEEQIEMSHAAFSSLVNEKSEPTLRNARKIARVLGVSDKDIWPEAEE